MYDAPSLNNRITEAIYTMPSPSEVLCGSARNTTNNNIAGIKWESKFHIWLLNWEKLERLTISFGNEKFCN